MTPLTVLVARRAVLDYARRPLNLVLLVVVPVVIVFVWGGVLADFATILGGSGDRRQIEAATAGWAAAALAGLAGFFQVTGAKAGDRRLAAAAGRTGPVVAGRLAASLALALLAAAGGLVALALRAGLNDPVRAIAATAGIAVLYLGIGGLVGTLVRSEMNGALVVTLVWILDVFLGPTFGPGASAATRIFPLHYPTLVLTGQASGHAGPAGDVGWSAAWAAGLLAIVGVRLARSIRPAPPPNGAVAPAPAPTPPSAPARVGAATAAAPRFANGTRLGTLLRAGMRDHRRNRVLWALLVAVPALFIGLAITSTVDTPAPVTLTEGARRFSALVSQRRMHAATMVPVTAAFLAGITGLFVVTGSAAADRRLVQAGFRCREVLAARLGVIGAATLVTTAAAVGVSVAWYPPQQLATFALASLLIAFTYAMVGVLVGPLTGRLGGIYLILLLAFIDVGLGQTVMFPGGPPDWGAYLPARGASQVLIDGALSARFDTAGPLLLGLAWLAALTAATARVFHRRTGVVRARAQATT